jgi:cytochrome c553
MQITELKIRYFWLVILIIAPALLLVLSLQVVAAAGYADSAHGNTSYGVNRSSTGYTIGSCAHCHDTFAPDICQNDLNGLMLFAPNDNPPPIPQEDNFCFQCHKGSIPPVQFGGIINKNYGAAFGGGTSIFTNIYDAFNPTTGITPSSHNLADVVNHAVDRDIGFTSATNACLVCHDQHFAQRNYPVGPSGWGGVMTAIRRPIDYASPPTNLWGDEEPATTEDPDERMIDYTNKYQAPYYKNDPFDPDKYEPANDGTAYGSNLPNFYNFCTNQCHGTITVYSTEHGRYLRKIDWANEEHGKLHNGGNAVGESIAPYIDNDFNYVLACTDCHEPHGSENEWLLRTTINGKDNISVPGAGEWFEVCEACHTFNHFHYGKVTTCWGDGVPNCHRHGAQGSMF